MRLLSAVVCLLLGSTANLNAADAYKLLNKPSTSTIFSSCGDGTVAVVRTEAADKYVVVETIATKPGAKTMALDPKTHKLYLPSVDYGKDGKGPRPTTVPMSFGILVYGK